MAYICRHYFCIYLAERNLIVGALVISHYALIDAWADINFISLPISMCVYQTGSNLLQDFKLHEYILGGFSHVSSQTAAWIEQAWRFDAILPPAHPVPLNLLFQCELKRHNLGREEIPLFIRNPASGIPSYPGFFK